MTGTGVVIPVRAFALGKARLAAQLDDETRTNLARKLADRVGAASGELPTVVVSSASDVREWARTRGLDVIDDPGTLDDAAAVGRGWGGAPPRSAPPPPVSNAGRLSTEETEEVDGGDKRD